MKINKVDITEFRVGITKKDALPEEFIKRIINYKEKLEEVETAPLNEIVTDFHYDIYPEIELSLWEKVSSDYESKIQSNPSLTLDNKKEIYNELLLKYFDKNNI